MMQINAEIIVYLKAFFWALLFFLFYYPLPNFLKISHFKKKKKYWEDWLTKGLSHQEYVEKYLQQNEAIKCYFCGDSNQGHHLHQALPKNISFGFIENTINSKNIHYLSHFCARCNSELFRHSHEV
jgi:hypothetical protein